VLILATLLENEGYKDIELKAGSIPYLQKSMFLFSQVNQDIDVGINNYSHKK
jgi:hypothetical protein